jgi:serine/threonine protein kinase
MAEVELLKSDKNEYNILKKIGCGGFSAVYMIKDLKTHKK